MTRGLRRAAAALLVLAAGGHVAYWYLPRERAAVPDARARAILLDPEAAAAAWVPFPHQNLARLERRVGDLRAWLELVSGGEGSGGRALPAFGPFVVPPARSLAVSATASGRLRAELDAYPAVALLARAAGTVARNPWLAGGAVRWGGGGRGAVRWQGWRWILEGSAAAPGGGLDAQPGAAGAAGAEALAPALALVRLGTPRGPLPAALYRVARSGPADRLEVVAGAPGPTPAAVERLFEAPAGEGPAGWLAERGPAGGARAIVLWDAGSDVPGLPATATLRRGPVEGFRLPAEGLARLFGRRLAEAESAGLEVSALERETAERAAAFAPGLAAALDQAPGLAVIAAARPGPLAARARAAAAALAAVPVVGVAEAGPLRRLAALLAPLSGCAAATLEVAAGGAAVRFVPCAGDVL